MKRILFGLLIALILGNYSCNKDENEDNITENDLVSYYPLNGNANDESGNEYHGVIYGASPTFNRFNNANSAFMFDGVDDYIFVEDYGNIVPIHEISVSMWLKPNDTKAQFQLMLCPDVDRFAVSAFYYHDGVNTTFWDYGWLRTGGDSPGRLYYRPEPIDTLWHHYVFISSIEQNFMKIYKDGNLINSKEYPLELQSTYERDLKIGSGDSHSYYSGLIDEIRIYNKVLTDNEISELYFE